MYTSVVMIQTAFILLLAFIQASVQQPPQESTARIEGIVVRADNGDPLPNVAVLLSKDGAGRLDTRYGTTTRADGHFTVKDLPKGRYRLSATIRGFVDQEYGQKRPNGSGTVLDVATETTLRDITIRMVKGGVISGHVSDQMGHPLEGAVIRAFRRRYTPTGKSSLSVVALTVTNDVGDYRMYWLAPGSYYLFAVIVPANPTPIGATIINQSDDPPDVFAPSFYPSGDDDSQAKSISVEPGLELRGVDFLLTRMKGTRVRGRIVDAETGDRADVSIAMRPKFIDPSERGAFGVAGNVDSDGKFEIRNVAAGKYALTSHLTLPGFRTLSHEEDVEVGNQDIANLQVSLKPNPRIQGRLITEGAEPPPRDRTVLLFNNYNTTAPYPESFGTGAQPDGTFVLSNVTPSVLQLELSGFPDSFYIRSARTDDGDVLTDGLDIREHSIDSLVVVVGSQGGMIEGTISNDNQETVAGASVVLIANATRRPTKTATTDHSGRFTIQGIAPGDYNLVSWEDVEPNAYYDPSFLEQYLSRGTPVHVDENGHIRVTLKPIRD
jgi:hypothetical protein